MKLNLLLISLIVALCLASCTEDDNYASVPAKVQGFKPVYFDTGQSINGLVFSGDTLPKRNAYRREYYKQFLLMEEPALGMHVFDNTNAANPKAIAFIHIPFSIYINVQDTLIIADTYIGLMKISISALPAIKVIEFTRYTTNGVKGIPPLPAEYASFSYFGRSYKNYYFECIDYSRLVAGWEKTSIENPKCYVTR